MEGKFKDWQPVPHYTSQMQRIAEMDFKKVEEKVLAVGIMDYVHEVEPYEPKEIEIIYPTFYEKYFLGYQPSEKCKELCYYFTIVKHNWFTNLWGRLIKLFKRDKYIKNNCLKYKPKFSIRMFKGEK